MYRQRKCGGEHCLLLGTLDTTDIRSALEKVESTAWTRYDFRTKFTSIVHKHHDKDIYQSTHQNTYTLPLYWLSIRWYPEHPVVVHRFVEFLPLFPWIQRLYDLLREKGIKEGIVVKAMFAALLPHQIIPTHVDQGYALRMTHRYHWVITTHPDVRITVNGIEMHWSADSVYEINNLFMHSVENPSDETRIHFIIDILPKEYITTPVSYDDINWEKYKQIEHTLY